MNIYEQNSKSNVNIILKTVGNACNLACEYCFEKVKNVENKIVTPNELDILISSILGTCSIVFHGGEPLMLGTKRFDELLTILEKYYPEKVISIRVQTNGTLLNEIWIKLLFVKYKKLNIEIAISLDGTKSMNLFRIYPNGKSTYQSIIKAYQLLDRYGIRAGMLSVITKEGLSRFREYVNLIDKIPNLSFVKINALFNIENGQLTYNSISPMEFAEFIYNVYCLYVERKLYKKVAIEPILSILQQVNKKKSHYCNYSDRKCFNYLSVYPGNIVGPCDCFSIDNFNIGTLHKGQSLNEMVSNYVESRNTDVLKQLIDDCKNCDIKNFCCGGCLSQRYYFLSNKALADEFCASKHFLFNKFNMFKIHDK